MARRPSAGLRCASSRCESSSGLSAPTSMVRMVTGSPCMPSTARRYAAYCSSSSGRRPRRFMNRNSLRNSPTPTAPASTAPGASSGSSMLASSSTFWPSSVTAGVCFSRARRPRSSSACRCLKPYSARMMGDGSTIITPSSPSMITQSSWRTSWLALRAPTTAGMSMLRATMAVCEVRPPTSVTKPANTLCLNSSMSAGDRSCATSTSGTSMLSSASSRSCWRCAPRRDLAGATGEATPFMWRSTRSTTCSRSALRSRRYSSSISSNWRDSCSSCVVSAHSAL